MRIARTIGGPTSLFSAAILLAACGGNTTQQGAPVVATVDGHELTIADMADTEAAVSRPANASKPTRAAVDSLINEHLMEQEALADGLDRDPAVTRVLDNARRRILAEAFASRLEPSRSPPSPAEVAAYYEQNPALFAARRLYSLAIFTVDSTVLNDELLTVIGHTTTVEALGQLLAQHSVGFELQHMERQADELPMSQLPKYSAAGVGDVLIETDHNGPTRLIQITGIELRPSSLENARPAIERYLTQRAKTAVVDAYLEGARSRARITYTVTAQEPLPSRTKRTPAPPRSQATIAQGTSTHVY